MLFLDTNAVIGYFAGDANLLALLNSQGERGEEFAIANVVVVELLGHPASTQEERNKILAFLSKTTALDLTYDIALEAATLRRSTRLTTTDAIIAATALVHSSPLVTRDQAFRRVPSLQLLS